MLAVLALIPLFLLTQLAAPRSSRGPWGWTHRVARALLIWGLLLVVIAEGLGMLGQLHQAGVAVAWGVISLALLAYLLHSRAPWVLPPVALGLRSLSTIEKVLLAGMAGVFIALATVALLSPPNNVDSLLYHLPRVRQWAQQGSLDFFPTTYAHQLFMPPWAEMTLLALRLLYGNDGLFNLLQLAAYGVCILGVVSLARSLGANRVGRWIAAAFAATIPMAILQATSTQTDLAVSLWLVLLANLVLWEARPHAEAMDYWYAGAALGLGVLTKGTFFPYALPLAAWLVIRRLRRDRLRVVIIAVAGIAGLALLINVPHWARTTAAYGSPFGPSEAIENHLYWTDETGRAAAGPFRTELRMMGRNLMTPVPPVNRGIAGILDSLPALFGPAYGQEMLQGLWNHEDTAGSLVHTALALTVVVIAILRPAAGGDRLPRIYAGAVLTGYLLLPLLFSSASELVGLRFQLPFLILAAPVVGLEVGRRAGRRAGYAFAALLIVISLPWVLFNNTRPIIGLPPNVTRTGSVLQVSELTSLFAMYQGRLDEYQAIADRVEELGCRQVGLRIDSHDPEYLFWRLLDSSPGQVVLTHVDPPPELARFADPAFEPCAVICTTCGEALTLDGLALDRRYGAIALYVAESSSAP